MLWSSAAALTEACHERVQVRFLSMHCNLREVEPQMQGSGVGLCDVRAISLVYNLNLS